MSDLSLASGSTYKTLTTGFIRVLHLQPAKSLEAPLVATLKSVHLDQEARYEALSYSWDGESNGIPLQDGSIILENVTHSIKGNLSNALRRLRHEDRPRIFWIDAICINQENLAERSAQVAIMARIFSTALRVIMWVGEDSAEGDGKAFIDWCLRATSIQKSSWSKSWRKTVYLIANQSFFYDKSDWVRSQYYNEPVLSWRPCKKRDLVFEFHWRRYFRRRWCVQETAFAKQVLLKCGSHEISLSGLRSANHYFHSALRWDTLQETCSDVLELMAQCNTLQCFDERDYIFALASLLRSQPGCPPITIDYTLSWTQVYINFTSDLIMADSLCQVWRVLHMAAGQYHAPWERSNELPSWVPDWRYPLLDSIGYKSFSKTNPPATLSYATMCGDGTTVTLRLAYFGKLSDVVVQDDVKEKYRSDDRLYRPHPEQMVGHVGYMLELNMAHLVLRAYGEEAMLFCIVGLFIGDEGGDTPAFVEMHDVFIR